MADAHEERPWERTRRLDDTRTWIDGQVPL